MDPDLQAITAERDALRDALKTLLPFVLEDYSPGHVTRAHREALENACHLVGLSPEPPVD